MGNRAANRDSRRFQTKGLVDLSTPLPDVVFKPFPPLKPGTEDASPPIWRVLFHVISNGAGAFGLDINDELVFGRRAEQPHMFDLSPYGAGDLGVSRQHLKLRPTASALYIIDQGSTNGTTRNGQPLGAKIPYRLADGDVLALGGLQIVANIITRPAGQPIPLKTQADLGTALAQVAQAITSQLELDEVLNQVVDAAMSLTKAGETGIWLVDESSGDLFLEAHRGIEDEKIRRMRLPIESDSLVAKVIESGEPVHANRKSGEEQVKVKTDYLVEALILAPIALGGISFGVLSATHRESGQRFSKRHERLLSTIADFAAIAIQNVRLYTRCESDRAALSHILQQVDDPIIVVDSARRIVVYSQKALSFLDRVPEGKTPDCRLLDDITSFTVFPELVDRAASGQPAQDEVSLTPDKIFNVHVSPISGVGYAVVMHDISHFKEIDRAKTEVIEMVSHQVRSPLTSILLYVELMQRTGVLNPNQREFVQQVGSSVRLITETINDLLDLGKIEAGMDRKREPVSLVEAAQYAVDRLQDQAHTKKVQLDIEVSGDIPTVLGNVARLRQVFVNLIDNAIKYTPEEGAVMVTLFQEEQQIVAQIWDSGIGISQDEQQKIFDKFYRADAVKEEYQGTGLGLAIVRSIVHEHEGRIWVDSRPGEGSAFIVVLPAYEEMTI